VAKFVNLYQIRLGGVRYQAGDVVDDDQDPVDELRRAGAGLLPYSSSMDDELGRFREISSRGPHPAQLFGLIWDSPQDGLPYVRKNGNWDVAPGGSGLELTDYHIVESLADFPTPSGGETTLTQGVWWINGSILMGDTKIRVPKGAYLMGSFPARDSLVWTSGAGARITLEGTVGDETHSIRNLSFIGLAGEDAFEMDGQSESIFLRDCALINISFGEFNFSNTFFAQGCQSTDCLAGLRFNSLSTGRVIMRTSDIAQATGAAVNIMDFQSAVFDLISLEDVQFQTASTNKAIEALGNANVTASTGRAEVNGCRFNGTGGTLAGGVTTDDVQWTFAGNFGIANSTAVGEIKISGNLAATVAAGVFEPILGTHTAGVEKRFSIAANGEATYLGLSPILFQFRALLLAAMASGGAKSISFQLYHKPLATGTPVPVGTPFTLNIINSPSEVEVAALIEIVTGDKLQLRLQNNDDAIGVVVSDKETTITAVPTGS
jgi:hypothetical protein